MDKTCVTDNLLSLEMIVITHLPIIAAWWNELSAMIGRTLLILFLLAARRCSLLLLDMSTARAQLNQRRYD